jgi:hypothetical protein
VLVTYDAVSDRQPGVQRRAYFLNANRDRLRAGRPPHFVNPNRVHGLQPLPSVPTLALVTNSLVTNLYSVVEGSNSFILYRPDSSPEACHLPYYQDSYAADGQWKRVLLTPLTVTVDVTVGVVVIGIVGGFVVGCEYVASGGPGN